MYIYYDLSLSIAQLTSYILSILSTINHNNIKIAVDGKVYSDSLFRGFLQLSIIHINIQSLRIYSNPK